MQTAPTHSCRQARFEPTAGCTAPRGVLHPLAAAAAGLALCVGALAGGTIPIPNGSFESPVVVEIVDPRIDSWEKTPQPVWWDTNVYGAWDNLVGAFENVPAGDPRHIENCDGNQAIWVFANPEVGLFQDYDSRDWSNTVPSHAFDARFEIGASYQLTVGVLVGTAFPMAEGATLELSLYYRDAASNRVTVAATTVTNTPAVFNNGTNLLDFHATVPPVAAGDAWAGQRLGVAILSTVTAAAGGYWVLDNVRLTSTRAPRLVGPTVSNGWFSFRVEGETGQRFEILASADVTSPPAGWASLGILTNATGSVTFAEPATSPLRRFYQARQLP